MLVVVTCAMIFPLIMSIYIYRSCNVYGTNLQYKDKINDDAIFSILHDSEVYAPYFTGAAEGASVDCVDGDVHHQM